MLYAQLIVYNKYSWLFSENSTHFRRGLPLLPLFLAKGLTVFCGKLYGFEDWLLTRFAISWLKYIATNVKKRLTA